MARSNGDGDASERGRSGDARAPAKAEARAIARAKMVHEVERRGRLCYAVELGGQGHGLSPPEVETLQAIAVGERTWTEVDQLERFGLNGTTLEGLTAVGWVKEFTLAHGKAVTFSPWAAEALGVEPEERWDVFSVVASQQDNALTRTETRVQDHQEVPRWGVRPSPPEPGAPKPKKVPIKLPARYQWGWLTDDVIQGLIKRTVPNPVDEAIENEEHHRAMERERQFMLMQEQVRTEDGRLDVDDQTGQVKVRVEPVLLWPTANGDGLRGGVADPHGGRIPIDGRIGKARKPSKKKKKRRKRPA